MEFNFNQNTVVEDISRVPSDFQGLYVKDDADGKYKLRSDDSGVKAAISALTGLNSALTKARGELKDAKGRIVDLSPLADFGDSPESILEAFNASIAKAGKGKGNVTEEVEKAVKAAKEALGMTHAEELKQHVTKNDVLKGQLYSLLVTNAATLALTEAKALNPALVMPFIKEQVQVEEEDGNFKVRVVGESGDTRYSGTTGDPMSIKELVGEMKANEKYMPLFQSESHSGGGGDPHAIGQKHRITPGGEEKTSQQKIASGLDKLRR